MAAGLRMFRITVWLIGLASLIACRSTPQPESQFAEDRYMAHLQLDSSVLVITEVVAGLDVPWELAYGPDGWLWFTEQKGTVNRLNPETGEKQVVLQVPDVHYKKSTGLLGMVLHPDLDTEPYVYLFYNFAYPAADNTSIIKSRIVRYTWQHDTLSNPKVLLDSIPGKNYHNGSRLVVTPDRKLLASTGDVGAPKMSQDVSALSGKILRLNLDGSIPADNPIANSPIWTWGHRNIQGLVYASNGKLYSSEHGPNNDDEVNLIEKGRNYGWPLVEGYCDKENEKQFCHDSLVVEPLIAWTPTIAVSGLDYYGHSAIPEWQNRLLAVNLKGQALRVLDLNESGNAVTKEHIFFQKHFGRMRDLTIAPNGDVYLSTSNTDWHPRFQAWMYDSLPEGGDRIIRLQRANPAMLAQLKELPQPLALAENTEAAELFAERYNAEPTGNAITDGQGLYLQHCAPCHRPDGQGAEGLIPPLANSEWVTGDKSRLIQVLLHGLSDPIEVNGVRYDQEMPAFASLSDQELANIMTYIRRSFGNEADAVIAVEVYEERKSM